MAMPIAGQNGVVMLSIEIVDDEMINAFTQEIKKVDGYQEEWESFKTIPIGKLSGRQ